MFAMFTQVFTTIAVLFAALEKFAGSFNHLGTWAEETAGAFSDESRINRVAKMNALRAKHNITDVDVPNTVLPAPVVD